MGPERKYKRVEHLRLTAGSATKTYVLKGEEEVDFNEVTYIVPVDRIYYEDNRGNNIEIIIIQVWFGKNAVLYALTLGEISSLNEEGVGNKDLLEFPSYFMKKVYVGAHEQTFINKYGVNERPTHRHIINRKAVQGFYNPRYTIINKKIVPVYDCYLDNGIRFVTTEEIKNRLERPTGRPYINS